MLEYARWKYVLILIVVLASALYALPNVFPQDPSIQITPNRGFAVDTTLRKRVDDALAQAKITPKGVEVQDNGNLLVRTRDVTQQGLAADAVRPALGNDYTVALNLASTVPAWLDAIGARPMLLGLDLQGGVHFLMQVDKRAALDKRLDAYAEDIRSALRDGGVIYESVDRNRDDSFAVRLRNPGDAEKAQGLISRAQPTISQAVNAGVITATVPQADLDRYAIDAIDQNVATLRNRINAIGVGEPVVQRQGADRVVVELPGVQDTAEAKRLIGATATLEYRAAIEGNAQDAIDTGKVPPDARVYYQRKTGLDGKPIPILLSKRLIASGEQVVSAQAITDPQTGTPAVSVQLNSAGGARMFDFTSLNVGKPMAVVYIERVPETKIVDGKEVRTSRVSQDVISVANIQGVFSKQFQTTGLERKEADDLAKLLKSGSLAAPMDFIEERIVGPSLGAENVERGLKAVLFSFSFVLVFFLFYYRMFGIVTCVALLLNLLMVFAVMSLFGATMSLPGLAGIALTVGMSVDANVLINERIREELRIGLPPQAAIAAGYDRAAGTIADANITALLAALALYAFGDGPVKGFGLSMGIGILTSMYTAVSVSRGIATLMYGRRRKLKSIAI
jgi:preprotein translocase subunit SecD